MASFQQENDISLLIEKCSATLEAMGERNWLLMLSFGRVSLNAIKAIVECMGRVVIDIGDRLTLLHLAGQCNRPDWVHFLAGEMHHPTEVKTIHGETPLDQAAWRGNIDAAIALIRFEADVDCQTLLGYSPLHRCAFYNHPRLGSLLCLAGANQTLRDENNETAYEVALAKGNKRLIKLLTPIIDGQGNNISGVAYAVNNPKHPNYRPEARDAFFTLCALDNVVASANQEAEENMDDDDVWEDIDDDDDDDDENS